MFELWGSLLALAAIAVFSYMYFNKTKHKNDIKLKCKDGVWSKVK